MEYDSWKVSVECKTLGSWNLHEVLPRGMDFFILLSSASGLVGLRGQANYDAGNTYQDALARYRVAQGEKAVALDLGAMKDDGQLAENPDLLSRVLGYGALEPISRRQFAAILDYYCDPARPLPPSPIESQVAIGLGLGEGEGIESFDYSRQPMLTPLTFELARQKAAATEAGHSGDAGVNHRMQFAASSSLDRASDVVVRAMVSKLGRTLSALQGSEDVDAHRPLQMYGVDSLVAIELRNWLVKEFAADVAVFETQGAATLSTLSLLVAGRSTIKHEQWSMAD